MRKSLWIMLAVMVVAVSAPNAHADGFTWSFVGSVTGSGTFTATPVPDFIFRSPVLFSSQVKDRIAQTLTHEVGAATAEM